MTKISQTSSLATQPSLLNRLKSGDDTAGWREFYRLYGPLIHNFARKAGLSPDEAEEVVQETAVSVAKNLPGFTYDPKRCAFKTWLLNLARWRVTDHFRKRRRTNFSAGEMRAPPLAHNPRDDEETQRTATVNRVPDPSWPDFEGQWDTEYDQRLLALALESLKMGIDLKQFQVFDCYVLKQWPAGEVAQALGVSVASVYLAKHRVAGALKKEIARLEREWERSRD